MSVEVLTQTPEQRIQLDALDNEMRGIRRDWEGLLYLSLMPDLPDGLLEEQQADILTKARDCRARIDALHAEIKAWRDRMMSR